MQLKTDLIARLAKEAADVDQKVIARMEMHEVLPDQGQHARIAAKSRQHAADLRAAAAAVRLVAECREALDTIRHLSSDSGSERGDSAINGCAGMSLEKIAEWEGKHGG